MRGLRGKSLEAEPWKRHDSTCTNEVCQYGEFSRVLILIMVLFSPSGRKGKRHKDNPELLPDIPDPPFRVLK